jgi:glycerophosphoryl diester phosphodiesterase
MCLAHRGDHRAARENTLDAFAAALRIPGCDGIELDVRASRDGDPVVVHDQTLGRVFGSPYRVRDLTAAELTAAGVPSLAAVLALIGPVPFLDVDLKEDVGDAVVAAIQAARGTAPTPTVCSSFDPVVIARIRRIAPAMTVWLNATDLSPDTIDLARSLGCVAIAAERASVVAQGVAEAEAAGLRVAAWTVTDRAERRRVEAVGVVAVCVEGPALG